MSKLQNGLIIAFLMFGAVFLGFKTFGTTESDAMEIPDAPKSEFQKAVDLAGTYSRSVLDVNSQQHPHTGEKTLSLDLRARKGFSAEGTKDRILRDSKHLIKEVFEEFDIDRLILMWEMKRMNEYDIFTYEPVMRISVTRDKADFDWTGMSEAEFRGTANIVFEETILPEDE